MVLQLLQKICLRNFNKILIVLLLECFIIKIRCDLVILKIHDEANENNNVIEICALKKQMVSNNDVDYNKSFKLLDVTPYDGCAEINNQSFSNKTTFMLFHNPPNCTLQAMLKNLEFNSARLAIIGSNGPIRMNLTNSNLTLSPIFMPIMYANIISDFINTSVSSVVELYTTNEKFDAAIIFIWLIAISTVIFGSLWSNYEFVHSLKTQSVNGQNNERQNNANDENQQGNVKNKDDSGGALLSLSYLGIFVLLMFVIAILLLLYFFYNIIIYFVYVIFSFGAIMSMFRICCLVFDSFDCGKWRFPENNIPVLKSRPQIVHTFLATVCIAICVIWFVFRHAHWIWVIQNLMAVSLAANALSFYRLSSYKIVTVVLILFFLYDIFMVFISPYITQGVSIMEAVAFGGRDSSSRNSKEGEIVFNNSTDDSNRLPVVIVIPRMSKLSKLCKYYLEYPYSLLGLGDMLIPGLSVNYGIIFDTATKNRFKIYFIANIIAYGIGLFIAFIGLIFMNKAQPALFYLCPAHLIATFVVAFIKKDLRNLWTGEPIHQYTLNNSFTRTQSHDQINQIENTSQPQEVHEQQQTCLVVDAATVNNTDYKY